VLEHVTVTRYATPLREGGSLPAIVEADNLGTYVMKFRGAGQGPKALVAEIICGELARRLGLRTPELALGYLDPRIPPSEPDPEIQDLLRASCGLNLLVDFLPGSAGFDSRGWKVDPGFGDAHAALAPLIGRELLDEVTALVPPAWFGDGVAGAYVSHLLERAPRVMEVIRG
jgi:hypothetical protein